MEKDEITYTCEEENHNEITGIESHLQIYIIVCTVLLK